MTLLSEEADTRRTAGVDDTLQGSHQRRGEADGQLNHDSARPFGSVQQPQKDEQIEVRPDELPGGMNMRETNNHDSEQPQEDERIIFRPDESSENASSRERNSQSPQSVSSSSSVNDSSNGDETENEETHNHKKWFRRFRLKCGEIVNDPRVQLFVIVLIVVNALIMGVATFDFVSDDGNVSEKFEKVDRTFLIIFTIELALQIIYRGWTLFQDGWLTFDFFIVIFSWAFESLQVVRAFRVFRVFRLITRVKPLRDLVIAIGAVLPRMYAITALLALIFYIFAVLFTELFKDLDLEDNYFRSLDASLFTCFELMTLEWAGIVRGVMELETYAWAPFLIFINITGFIVFNLIVAVVCDAVAVVERQSKAEDDETEIDMESQLCHAQHRVDYLTEHVDEMLEDQKKMQEMINAIGCELKRRKLIKNSPGIPENPIESVRESINSGDQVNGSR
eukprot:CAMPEP_0195308134 /NCGR_PEP_ID=MMETSP0707-20130614/38070_1 /TAXON_ID=33640 /ORGANISM="Asterionellopsis glacialis, Strain CCMP134" /LENGTH=449 /DNA_ID=CAMNT_0040372393 /DNA_START=677 /DNA_END=2026 /DNA_ORIENTATION=-